MYWYDLIDKYLPRNCSWHDLFLADESPFRIPESENKGCVVMYMQYSVLSCKGDNTRGGGGGLGIENNHQTQNKTENQRYHSACICNPKKSQKRKFEEI